MVGEGELDVWSMAVYSYSDRILCKCGDYNSSNPPQGAVIEEWGDIMVELKSFGGSVEGRGG